MVILSRRYFLGATLAVAGCSEAVPMLSLGKSGFVCAPCGCSNDGKVFDEPGRCSACGMTLEPITVEDLGLEPTTITPGAGHFVLGNTIGRADRPIRVDYYLPVDAQSDARLLIVLPGTGRDSAEYRNQWLTHARDRGVVVAALGYPEDTYSFADYHMGGLIEALDTSNIEVDQSDPSVTLLKASDDALNVEANPDRTQWIFDDAARVFAFFRQAAKLKSETFDVFGHSAGGQLAHRMALFGDSAPIGKIIAANSGFYTLPDVETTLPLGIKGAGISSDELATAFSRELVVLVGELDNRADAGGTFLSTPALDAQGNSRLARGRSFYAAGQAAAQELGVDFNWQLETVPGVGHDGFEMGAAASNLL